MIHRERMTARMEGEFAVFLIGMRINQPWLLHKWLPVATAMPRMLKELYAKPGTYENVYANMPAFGLGKAGTLVAAKSGLQSAAGRLRSER